MIGFILFTKPRNQIGTLKRNYGYNGYKPIPKGTPVYQEGDRCYFEMTSKTGEIHRQYFRTLAGDVEIVTLSD